ncbi:MAG: PD40 domain-containing protein [Anaerolineae bacterium]|nr:PD40 domain-containing protein [Anaerolineae bacterium]
MKHSRHRLMSLTILLLIVGCTVQQSEAIFTQVKETGTVSTPFTQTAGIDLLQNTEATAATTSDTDNLSRIAFASNRSGNNEIYAMNLDGTRLQQITSHPASDTHPIWSPDGRRIAFISNREGSPNLYVMNSDGTGVVRLTDSQAGESNPVWSPDGTQIAFLSSRTGYQDLLMISPDGSSEILLTSGLQHSWSPSWSPDGAQIAYASEDGIHIIDLRGTTETTTTDATLFMTNDISLLEKNVAWSPDGSRIAFADSEGIHLINPDGSGLMRLTHAIHPWNAETDLAWSPDGTQLAFVTATSYGDDNDIFVVKTDGRGERQKIADTPSQAFGPTWTEDGQQIILSSGDEDATHLDIYAVNLATTELTRLTSEASAICCHSWVPNAMEVASVAPPTLEPILSATPIPPPANAAGEIIFSTGQGVFAIHPDGTGQRQIATVTPMYGFPMTPSPDGAHIALTIVGASFQGQSGGDVPISDIMIVDRNGQINRLTNNGDAVFDEMPTWSPDGAQIAFASYSRDPEDSGGIGIYRVNIDGTDLTRLADIPRGLSPIKSLSWSPDGTLIAYAAEDYGDKAWELYVMAADGAEVTRLTDSVGNDWEPVWSPDGTRIAFTSERSGKEDIYIIGADGTGPAQVTDHPGYDRNPIWSPDGSHLAFVSWRDGSFDIYVSNIEGSDLYRLTTNRDYDILPTWSPDGEWVAFVTRQDQGADISIVRRDGTGLFHVTAAFHDVFALGWLP